MPSRAKPPSTDQPIRAAQYVRMSTDLQQYSTDNQSAAIANYAAEHNFRIVRTFSDGGKSGLKISGRDALKELISQVEAGNADFDVILVYDVSRWGRFQDLDESAYYEYLCKRANIKVHYCAESFGADDTFSSAVMKTIKRSMAAEYSRELSVKVFAGQCRLIELGFRQGGSPGYGLRRQLQDQYGNPKAELKTGERKSLQTDRVILVPGPKEEIAVISDIYELFVAQHLSERQIADRLNDRNVPLQPGARWSSDKVHQILTNPKYIGSNVYNRQSFKLKKKRVKNPPEMWICNNAAFVPIVNADLFSRAQAFMQERHSHLSNEEMIERLRSLLSEEGRLSGLLIDACVSMPTSAAYRHRFGTLTNAYTLVGYTPTSDYSYVAANRALRRYHKNEVAAILERMKSEGASLAQDPRTDLLTVNGEFTLSIVAARCETRAAGRSTWLFRFDTSLEPDVTVAIRLAPGNESVLDYYLFPSIDVLAERLRLVPENGLCLDSYRFNDLQFLIRMARRVSLPEAA